MTNNKGRRRYERTYPEVVGAEGQTTAIVPVCTEVVDPRYLRAPAIFEDNLVPNYVKARVFETLCWIEGQLREGKVDSKLLETQIKYLQFAKELADKAPADPMEKYKQMRSMMAKEQGTTKKMTLTVEETVSG